MIKLQDHEDAYNEGRYSEFLYENYGIIDEYTNFQTYEELLKKNNINTSYTINEKAKWREKITQYNNVGDSNGANYIRSYTGGNQIIDKEKKLTLDDIKSNERVSNGNANIHDKIRMNKLEGGLATRDLKAKKEKHRPLRISQARKERIWNNINKFRKFPLN